MKFFDIIVGRVAQPQNLVRATSGLSHFTHTVDDCVLSSYIMPAWLRCCSVAASSLAYDMISVTTFERDCFLNDRSLKGVCTHVVAMPSMGTILSHSDNRKTQPVSDSQFQSMCTHILAHTHNAASCLRKWVWTEHYLVITKTIGW